MFFEAGPESSFPSSLTTALPTEPPLTTFTSQASLMEEADILMIGLAVFNDEGNQYFLVEGLPEEDREGLASDGYVLGHRPFRFMYHGNTGLVRVFNPAVKRGKSYRLASILAGKFLAVGVPQAEAALREDDSLRLSSNYVTAGWMSMTCFRAGAETTVGGVEEGKSPDYSFLPLARFEKCAAGGQSPWPTMVIEAGSFESLPRLREEAKWWFHHSLGDVRFVLVLGVSRSRSMVYMEKWQLMHLKLDNPFSQTPPLIRQSPGLQHPFARQRVTLSCSSPSGDIPIMLPFEALFDRPSPGSEKDIHLRKEDLMTLAFMY